MINIKPSLAEFKQLAKKGNVIPLYVDVLADQITPVSLLTSQWNKSSHCFLLESVEGGEKLGRYSIVSFEPQTILNDFDALEHYMREVRAVHVPGLPRFFGGAVGYCSYEVVHEFERLPQSKPDVLKWPTTQFFITGDLFVFDNTQQLLKIIVCARIKNKQAVTKAYNQAKARILAALRLLKTQNRKPIATKVSKLSAKANGFSSNMDKPAFMSIVKKAKEYIGKGDIIQVVLSRRNERQTSASPLDIYRALRVVNPSPYMYLFKIKDRAIIGSSPESLIRLEEGVATTRPIAGTRRRGNSRNEDNRLQDELLADPKERAEHIMLVDLGRNDLGRVCEPGSVKVPIFMTVERYSHVMHIVSEVTGKLKPKKDCFDLFKASFPAGTVAGAPKIRAMEIIDELETVQRNLYAGAIGYISYSGNMDMAITIRTILWENGKISIQTGAGIVADSDPAKEFQETENKAAGMKETLHLAENGALFLERI